MAITDVVVTTNDISITIDELEENSLPGKYEIPAVILKRKKKVDSKVDGVSVETEPP